VKDIKNNPPTAKAVMADRGFSLVELLIVMAILAILIAMAVGVLNPIALVNRAKDSRRKNDLNKFKVAFEEYYNDKGVYPYEEMDFCKLDQNCGKEIPGMKGYLNNCLCDPNDKAYTFLVDLKWFKVMTNLENKNDKSIPSDWYTDGSYSVSGLDKESVNYGVSSSNILWYERKVGSDCDWNRCYTGGESCNDANAGCKESEKGYCYLFNTATGGTCHDPICRVPCCGSGCSN